jgi:hypothetical protein
MGASCGLTVRAARRQQKTAGAAGGFLGCAAFSYAFASPAAERCENQKYAKKNDAGRMAAL